MTTLASDMSYEDYLAHYGIKGMKWGTNKSPQTRLSKAKKKMDKIDGNTIVEGANYRGHYGKKQYKREVKKNPDFKYGSLSPEAKALYDKKISNRAYRGIAARTALDVGIAFGVGKIGGQKVFGLNDKNSNIAAGMITASVVLGRANQIRAVSTHDKSVRLRKDIDALTAEIKKGG